VFWSDLTQFENSGMSERSNIEGVGRADSADWQIAASGFLGGKTIGFS
jgi:hypothetical protein